MSFIETTDIIYQSHCIAYEQADIIAIQSNILYAIAPWRSYATNQILAIMGIDERNHFDTLSRAWNIWYVSNKTSSFSRQRLRDVVV